MSYFYSHHSYQQQQAQSSSTAMKSRNAVRRRSSHNIAAQQQQQLSDSDWSASAPLDDGNVSPASSLPAASMNDPPSYAYNSNYYHYDDDSKISSANTTAASNGTVIDEVEQATVLEAAQSSSHPQAISPFSLPLMSPYAPSPIFSASNHDTNNFTSKINSADNSAYGSSSADYYSDLSAASANTMLKVVRYLKNNRIRFSDLPQYDNEVDDNNKSSSSFYSSVNDSSTLLVNNLSHRTPAYPSQVRVTNAHLYTTATFQHHHGNDSNGELNYLFYGEPTLATWLVIILAVIMSFMCLVTIVGNILILHSLRIEKRLHTVSNIFIGSLAIADLIVGFFVMPLSTYYILNEFRWSLGLFTCQLWLAMDYVASTASIFNLFALSLDRFWSITSPLKYLKRRTKKRALVMVGIVWAASALWTVPVVFGHYVFNGGVRLVPAGVCDTEFLNALEFKIFTAIINFYLPLIVMLCLYGKIFAEIRKQALTFQPGTKHKGGASSTSDRSRTESSSTTNIGGLGGGAGGGAEDLLLSKKPRRSKSSNNEVEDEGESLHNVHRHGSRGSGEANDINHRNQRSASSSGRHRKHRRSKQAEDGKVGNRHGSRERLRQKSIAVGNQIRHCSLDADSSSGHPRRGTFHSADENSTSGNTQQSLHSESPSLQAMCSGVVDSGNSNSVGSGATSANCSLGYEGDNKRASTTSSGGGTGGSSQSQTLSNNTRSTTTTATAALISANTATMAAARAGILIGTYVLPSLVVQPSAVQPSMPLGFAITRPARKTRRNFLKSLFGKSRLRSESSDGLGGSCSNSSSSATLPVIAEQSSFAGSSANIMQPATSSNQQPAKSLVSQQDGFIPTIVVDAFSNDDDKHLHSSESNDDEEDSSSRSSIESLPIVSVKNSYRSYGSKINKSLIGKGPSQTYIIPCITVVNFDDEETRDVPTILVEGSVLDGTSTAQSQHIKMHNVSSGDNSASPNVHIAPAVKNSIKTSAAASSTTSSVPEIIVHDEDDQQQEVVDEITQSKITTTTATNDDKHGAAGSKFHKDSLDQDDDEAFAPEATDDLKDSDTEGEADSIHAVLPTPPPTIKVAKSRTPRNLLKSKPANGYGGGSGGGGVVGTIAASMLRRLNITSTAHPPSLGLGGGGMLSVPNNKAGKSPQDDDLHSLSNFQFGEDEQTSARRGSNEMGSDIIGGAGGGADTGNWLTTKLMAGARRFSITSIISSNPETLAWPSFGQHFPYNQQAQHFRGGGGGGGGGLLGVGNGDLTSGENGVAHEGNAEQSGSSGPTGLCLPPGMNTARRPSVITEFLRKQLARRKQGRSAAESNFQRQKKAAFQLGVILSAFIACWLPYFVSFLLVAVCPTCISIALHIFLTWLGYVNSGVNPFLYSYTNVNFRRAILKTISCDYYRENKQRNGSQKIRCDGQSQAAPAVARNGTRPSSKVDGNANDYVTDKRGSKDRPGFFVRHGRRMILVPLSNRGSNNSNRRSGSNKQRLDPIGDLV